MHTDLSAVVRSVRSMIFCVLCMLTAHVTTGQAGEFHNALSLQGFTGLLNIPNAEVTAEGRLYALFSDQEESKWRDRTNRQENYMFSVGLFSFAELGGRVTEAPGAGVRDLSGNFKIRVPFIPKGYYLPSVAFGIQDFGGGAPNLETKYVVASEELWRLRLSIGYGTGPDRMEGVFGGGELKAFDWLYLAGEYDTAETNVGARLITPEFFGIPVNFQVTAKTSLSHRPGDFEFGIGLQFPLGLDHFYKKPLPAAPETASARGAVPQAAPSPESAVPLVRMEPLPGGGDAVDDSLQRLRDRLAAAGFQNVRVGRRGMELLVVEYENSRFNHNEMDGLGVVAGTAILHAPPDFGELRLIMKKKGIRILQLEAPFDDFRMFMEDAGKVERLRESLRITTDVANDEGVRFAGKSANPSWLRGILLVYPALKTAIATDIGLFDYLLSLKPDLYINTWKGAVINARWNIPVSWSENFDDEMPFGDQRGKSELDRLMLFQAIKASPTVMANLGAGMVFADTYGTINELFWTPGDGTHRLTFKHAYARDSEDHSTVEMYLGDYRYYFSPLELYLTAVGGKFKDRDKGFKLSLKRFFGDTSFQVYYKNSETADGEHLQVGGFQVTFPLTPRKDMKPLPLQVRGSDAWGYAQETVIVSPGESNVIGESIGVNTTPDFNLEHIFYNRDRLNAAYVKRHLLRLRDAYAVYVLKQ